MRQRTRRALLSALALTITALVATAAQANAASPWFRLTSRTIPTHIAPGGEGVIIVQAINLGNAETAGKYSFTDQFAISL